MGYGHTRYITVIRNKPWKYQAKSETKNNKAQSSTERVLRMDIVVKCAQYSLRKAEMNGLIFLFDYPLWESSSNVHPFLFLKLRGERIGYIILHI